MSQHTELAAQQQPIQQVQLAGQLISQPFEPQLVAMLAARSPVGATPVGSQQVLKQLCGRSLRLVASGQPFVRLVKLGL